MPSLRSAIAAVVSRQAHGRRSLIAPVPAAPALLRALRKLSAEGTARAVRESEPLAVVQARLHEAAAARQTGTLERRDLRRVHEALWDGPRPLSGETDHLQAVLNEIADRRLAPSIRNLLSTYLIGYSPDRPGIRPFSAWLQPIVPAFGGVWRARAQRLSLFDVDAGPRNVAATILNGAGTVRDLAGECGLEGQREFGGMAAAAFTAACDDIRRRPPASAAAAQLRLIEWSTKGEANGKLGLHFSDQWSQLAAALFVPWQNQEPPAAHKTALVNFALKAKGDPRVVGWQPPGSPAELILKRWLNKVALLQFFRYVDDTANSHQWEYRRAFWTAWFDANHVSDAWVALGPDAARLAASRRLATSQEEVVSFGRTSGGGRGSRQSALLLRIGNLIIADWSHNGRYNIWRAGPRSRAPKFYKAVYDGSEFQSDEWFGSHTSADRYGWQSTVARLIKDETGLSTDQRKWRP